MNDDLRQFLHRQYGLVLTAPPQPLPVKGDRRVFLLQTTQGAHIAKLTDPQRTEVQVERDIAALLFLERHNFPAPRVVRSSAGRPFLRFNGRYLYLYPAIAGRAPRPDGEVFQRLGTLLGRLHRLPAADYPHVSGFTPAVEFPLVQNLLRRARSAASAARVDELLHDIATFPTFEALPAALIHTDPYFANMVQQPDGQLFLVDFDGAGRAPALLDVGYVVAHACTLTARDRRRYGVEDQGTAGIVYRGDWARAFLDAYQRVRPLSEDERALLPHAASFAMLVYMLDWDTGALLVPNYERYHLLKRELPRLDYSR